MSDKTQKKTCFVITPIGDEGSEIRRHIDGIIEAAIIPVLDTEFEVKAAHHINEPGNITKQIIKRIYESDLVIANITDRNPNVMYELALRHCVGKPTIMISDKNTSLPSDIISERTNFYINDSKGVLELKQKLRDCISTIDFQNPQLDSPIYDVLSEIIKTENIIKQVKSEDQEKGEVFSLIIEKLMYIENQISSNIRRTDYPRIINWSFSYETCNSNIDRIEMYDLSTKISESLKKDMKIELTSIGLEKSAKIIEIEFKVYGLINVPELLKIVSTALNEVGYNGLRKLDREMA